MASVPCNSEMESSHMEEHTITDLTWSSQAVCVVSDSGLVCHACAVVRPDHNQSSHGESGVARRTRRRLPPPARGGRGGGAGGEADAHPWRPAGRGGRRGGRRMAQLGREPFAGAEPRRRPAAWPVTDGSGRPPGRAPPRPNRALVRLRQAPPGHPSITGADPSIAATAARALVASFDHAIIFFFRRMWRGLQRDGAMCSGPDR